MLGYLAKRLTLRFHLWERNSLLQERLLASLMKHLALIFESNCQKFSKSCRYLKRNKLKRTIAHKKPPNNAFHVLQTTLKRAKRSLTLTLLLSLIHIPVCLLFPPSTFSSFSSFPFHFIVTFVYRYDDKFQNFHFMYYFTAEWDRKENSRKSVFWRLLSIGAWCHAIFHKKFMCLTLSAKNTGLGRKAVTRFKGHLKYRIDIRYFIKLKLVQKHLEVYTK